MEYPRLKTRPRSTHTVTEFKGLWHNEACGEGYWYDERDLSSDEYPMMSQRKARYFAPCIDGNMLTRGAAAFCGGDHVVILDDAGVLWCNNHTLDLIAAIGDTQQSGISSNSQILRMGGLIIVKLAQEDGSSRMYWVRYAPLAAGEELAAGTDYGPMEQSNRRELQDGEAGYIRLNMYDMQTGSLPADKVLTGSEPAGQAGYYWLDATGDTTVLRTWSETTVSWVLVETTYVQVYAPNSGICAGLEEGDVVKFTFVPSLADDGTPDDELQSAIDLLSDTWHRIVKKQGNNTMVIEGMIRPAEGSHTYNNRKGFYCRLETAAGQTEAPYLQVERKVPEMDFVVAAGNRLWGCRYGPGEDGEILNEIYASKLGDPRNWYSFQGISTDSWTASRGTAAPYTGAAVLHDNPLFFREESMDKVYPSNSGAHQIQTFDIDGVQAGSDRSLVVIDDKLYYKSRLGFCAYSGTIPQRISAAFGELQYTDVNAGRDHRRYMAAMTGPGGERLVGVYDVDRGIWHLESQGWSGQQAVTWQDQLYYIDDSGEICRAYDDTAPHLLDWYAESGVISYQLPEHKYISCVRLRLRVSGRVRNSVTISIMYDDTGTWENKKVLFPGTENGRLRSVEANIFPRRCDHFRLRLEGSALCTVYSISYRMERSEGGH